MPFFVKKKLLGFSKIWLKFYSKELFQTIHQKPLVIESKVIETIAEIFSYFKQKLIII